MNVQIENIESNNPITAYDVECLENVQDVNNTPEVLQQTIIKLCQVEQSLNTFITDVTTNYVQIVDINTYIENYLNNNPEQQLISNRMVPFSAQPYFGSLSPFDASGAGIGVWDRIFLCNGNNATPDLRGRVAVGATDMPGASMDSAVNPNVAGNPTYNLNDVAGSNQVVLTTAQIPSHIHTGTVSAPTPSTHTHQMLVKPGVMGQGGATTYQDYSNPGGAGRGNRRTMDSGVAGNGSYESAFTQAEGDHSHNVTIDPTGGNLGHNNYQPGIGAYYIIYIP